MGLAGPGGTQTRRAPGRHGVRAAVGADRDRQVTPGDPETRQVSPRALARAPQRPVRSCSVSPPHPATRCGLCKGRPSLLSTRSAADLVMGSGHLRDCGGYDLALAAFYSVGYFTRGHEARPLLGPPPPHSGKPLPTRGVSLPPGNAPRPPICVRAQRCTSRFPSNQMKRAVKKHLEINENGNSDENLRDARKAVPRGAVSSQQ